MWNGIEDIYINKTGEILPDNFFFVLSALGSFCYLRTPKADLKRMVALGDGRTKKMYEFLAPIAGFEYKHYSYKTFEKALKKAKNEIDLGYPVVLGALDMFYLPYFKNIYEKEHIPFHYILMVGYDDEEKNIYFYDCGREELMSLSYLSLSKAMNCSYPGLSKENTVCTIRMTENKDKVMIAREAMLIKKELFLNPPTGFLGYKGFQKFIKELPKWKKELNKEEYDKILANMVCFFGTVPNALKGIDEPDCVKFNGGFEKISRVFRSLGSETNNNYWNESAEFMDKCADSVSRISDIIIKYLCGREDNTDLLPSMFNEVLNNMIKAYETLNIKVCLE